MLYTLRRFSARRRMRVNADGKIQAFRERVLAEHRPAFDLHSEVLGRFEAAVTGPRDLSTPVRLALDMLMYQAFKSSSALSLLVQHALLEDAATLNRRLMELAIAAAYINADGSEGSRASRAARYLVHMWRQLPEEALRHIPPEEVKEWQELDATVGASLPASASRWGPRWRDMFADVGALDLYEQDYRYLSNMAHGSPDDLVVLFSHQTINIHRHKHASILLTYGARYTVLAGGMWNNIFGIIPDGEMSALIEKTTRSGLTAKSDST